MHGSLTAQLAVWCVIKVMQGFMCVKVAKQATVPCDSKDRQSPKLPAYVYFHTILTAQITACMTTTGCRPSMHMHHHQLCRRSSLPASSLHEHGMPTQYVTDMMHKECTQK